MTVVLRSPMRLAKLSSPVLVTAVLLSFAIVIVAATLLIFTAMRNMADHANSLDGARATQTANGALSSLRLQLNSAMRDYTAWDDAAEAVYETPDKNWLIENFGVFTGPSALFDTYFLLGPNNEAYMAYDNGKPISLDYRSFFSPEISGMLAKVRSGLKGGDFQTAGFLKTSDGLAVVGISVVRSSDGKLEVPAKKAQLVVFARHLTEPVIEQMSRTYLLDGLKLVDSPSRSLPYAVIKNPSDAAIGAITWTPRSPGTDSYQRIRPLIFVGLMIVGLFFVGLLIFGIALVRKLKREERSAQKQVKHDPLSGLINRHGLFERLSEMAQEARGGGADLVLAYLDLDRFKDVNDAYGHFVGDQLIRGVTVGIQKLLPEGAEFARIGGDEFAIAFITSDAEEVCRRVEKMITGFFQEPLDIGGRVAAVGASIGIAISEEGCIDGVELLRRADMAMYRSKALRNGRAIFYNASMDEDREAKADMARDLRASLDAEELKVVYQPVVNAKTRAIVGVEALVRWDRKGHGMVRPDIFISIAEHTGLIDKLGEFVMRCAFTQAAAWPDIKVAVNVSPAQLHDMGFVKKTANILKEAGIKPHRAVIEITEGFFIRNPERARHSLSELRRLGMQIALDDFGSGFSSIGYLREFGFDRLKIDRSLIVAIGKERKAEETLMATIALASSFDIPVTAEGIETEEQADHLLCFGADEFQGYLFSKPVTADEITKLLSEQGKATIAA